MTLGSGLQPAAHTLHSKNKEIKKKELGENSWKEKWVLESLQKQLELWK